MGKSGENGGSARKSAETLAAQALSWLSDDGPRLNDFMVMTGATPADLVRSIAEPEFLGRVLDYLLSEDNLVKAFCDSVALPYTAPMQARALLPGGDVWNWT